MNPFDQVDKARSYNIARGKAASVDTEQFLLTVNVTGKISKKSFISECKRRPERFVEKIPKQKVQRLETELGRKKIQRYNGKVVCFSGELFENLLCLSLKEKNWCRRGFIVRITPAALSLSHSDGSMISSPKSNLMKYLETLTVSETQEVAHA